MLKNYESSRAMYLFMGVVLAVLLFVTAWPVLPMAGAITLFVVVLYRFCFDEREKAEKYARTKVAFGCGIGLMALLPISILFTNLIQQNDLSLHINEVRTIFDSCINNIMNFDITSNFQLYFTSNIIIWGIFLVAAFLVAAYFFYIIERNTTDDDSYTGGKKSNTFKEFVLNMVFLPDETTDGAEREPEDEIDGFTNPKQPTKQAVKQKQAEHTAKIKHTVQKSKQESVPSFLSAFGIFLIRPRLTIFLAVNYFLFWFKSGVPMAYNVSSLLMYLLVIAISLSGVAEWIFRKLENVRHVATFTEKERLLSLFESVKKRAMKRSKIISPKMKLYIVDSMSINAFSIGRNTIAITRGLMNTMNDEELEAVIAHEMSHIINGDTQVSMLITTASNAYIWTVLLISKALFLIETMTGGTSFVSKLLSFVRNILELALKYVIMVFTILVASTSRREEYKADKVAFELGYGEGLLSALYKFYHIEMSGKKKLIDKLQETHPITAYRIEAIEKMCCQDYEDEEFDEEFYKDIETVAPEVACEEVFGTAD